MSERFTERYAVYYMKPKFFRYGIMGFKNLKDKGILPSIWTLEKSHVLLKVMDVHEHESDGSDLEWIYRHMQGEVWSPNGEARDLIMSKGLAHTSMSVGDIIVDHKHNTLWMVDIFGFISLEQVDVTQH
jgi:hypothetical protein